MNDIVNCVKDIDVVVVGSCNIDLVTYTEKTPKPGETVPGTGFMMTSGGKGGNQAVMAGLLGGKVYMVARVGDDYFGTIYKDQIKKYGVNVSAVLTTPNIHTGIASILVSKLTGENQIVISSGANYLLAIEDFEGSVESLISRCKILVVQLEVNRDVSLYALKLAKKYGAITIFNTAPAYPDLDLEFFYNSDVICFNETEAEIISGKEINNNEKMIINTILDFGPKAAVLTKGKYGASLMFASNRDKIHNINPAVKDCIVKDTTGAGDCFVGTLAYLMAKNCDNNDLIIDNILTHSIVQQAVNIAALSVQKMGAQASYPSINEIPKEYLPSIYTQ